jgi:hypothetical protein
VRGRFSKQPDEIATAYQAYFGAWQIHPEQQVPFLMDGQMFGAGNAALGQIGNKLKDGLALALRQAQAAAVLLPEYGRFFCATT